MGVEAVLEQELENDVEGDESAKESNTKKGRGQNKDYEIIEQFESEKEFDTYWKEQNYEKEYNKYEVLIAGAKVKFYILLLFLHVFLFLCFCIFFIFLLFFSFCVLIAGAGECYFWYF